MKLALAQGTDDARQTTIVYNYMRCDLFCSNIIGRTAFDIATRAWIAPGTVKALAGLSHLNLTVAFTSHALAPEHTTAASASLFSRPAFNSSPIVPTAP